jgi:hypothetical protein
VFIDRTSTSNVDLGSLNRIPVRIAAFATDCGWGLGIGPEAMTLVARDRQSRTPVPTALAITAESAMRYRAGDGSGEIAVLVFDRTCMDSMSGRPYPKTVEIRHGDHIILLNFAPRSLEDSFIIEVLPPPGPERLPSNLERVYGLFS